MEYKRSAAFPPTLFMGLPTVMSRQFSDTDITGETVELLSEITIHISGISPGATTEVSDHYAIHDIAPGTYSVEARCTGYISSSKKAP